MRDKQALFFVAIVILVLIVTGLAPEVVEFKPIGPSDVTGLLAILIFVSLILERFLDVFLTVSRAQGSEKISTTLADLQTKVREHRAKNEEVPTELSRSLNKARDELADYKARTRMLSMWYGFGFAILVSCVGVRAIGSFAESRSLDGLPAVQYYLFNLVDILLTGGLLAGGSDGIHKIAELLRTVLETSTKNYREKSEAQPPVSAAAQPAPAAPASPAQ